MSASGGCQGPRRSPAPRGTRGVSARGRFSPVASSARPPPQPRARRQRPLTAAREEPHAPAAPLALARTPGKKRGGGDQTSAASRLESTGRLAPRLGFPPSPGNTDRLFATAAGKARPAGRGGEGSPAHGTAGVVFEAGAFQLRHPNSGHPGNSGRGGSAQRRGACLPTPGVHVGLTAAPGSPAPAVREGRQRLGGAVTAAPPCSYLGGAAREDALPAGSRRRRAGLMGSAPLPRRTAGCLSEGGPGHYPGAAAGPALRSGRSGRAGGGLCRRGRPSGL